MRTPRVLVTAPSPVFRSGAGSVSCTGPTKGSMSEVVYVVTAWHERTNEDTVLVFADKGKADASWAELDGDTVYGGVYRRTVKD